MLIKNTSPCFCEFGGITLRPGSTEVVPGSLADLPDFKAGVRNGKIIVLSEEGEPEAGSKGWESLEGDDLVSYAAGLFDLDELKVLSKYSSKDKKIQTAVRAAAMKQVTAIEEKKAEAGA